MGEVYRARDTKLNRDVALKVLPEQFALEPDRLARFQREAQVLASLNHPNIAAIYGFEESRSGGSVESPSGALVLELVEGPTLADRLVAGPIPLEEALPIARQIADALDAAHEHGIVHRDLKPANIKLRADDVVKVLDFGLAKLTEAPGPRAQASGLGAQTDLTASPTITTPAMTMAGMILGTAAYMSPEQAKGRVADKRSDIWAFGCVLFEMLTGRRAFDGDDVADTLAFVLTKPPDWGALPKATPVAVSRLLRRSLEKDRKRRLSDIADARLELDEGSTDRDAADQHSSRVRGVLGVRERVGWVIGLLIAVAVAAAALFVAARARTPADAPEMRVDIVTPPTSDPASFALSPDGRFLAFVGESDANARLWLRPLDQATAHALAGTEGAAFPFWSPDSRKIGFFAGGSLKRVDISGGMPRTLANAAPGFGGTWSADDVILFASTSTTSLLRVPADGGEAVAQTTLDRPHHVGHSFPIFLPGGRDFLFFARGANESRGIYLGSLDAPGITRLTDADGPPFAHVSRLTPPASPSMSSFGGNSQQRDWLMYVRQGTLMAQQWDPTKKALIDDPISIVDSVVAGGGGVMMTIIPPSAFSASRSGLIAYRAGASVQSQLTWFDRSGRAVGTFDALDETLQTPELSPDGRQVAASRTVESNSDVFLMDGARRTRQTSDVANERYPVWSPDGRWLAFVSERKGVGDLYRKRVSGGVEEQLWTSPHNKNVDDWSPDGRFLLYNEEDPVTLRNLWVLPLDGDRKPFVFLQTNFQEHRGQFSPDGRFVAYVSNEPGQNEIFVRPFPASDSRWQISSGGGIQPRWSHDGKEIYYVAPDGKLMATTVVVKSGAIEPGTPKELFHPRLQGGVTNVYTRAQYDVSSDGRFLINSTVEGTAASRITLLVNWKPNKQ
jgi:Tol biopolymer transport system component